MALSVVRERPLRASPQTRRGSAFDVRQQDMRIHSRNSVAWYLIISVALSLAGKLSASSITNFTKSVYYVPPADFHMHDFSKDEYYDLFSYWGSGIQYETLNEGSTILFMLGPACFTNPQGGRQFCGPMLPRNPSDLSKDFNKYFHGFVANLTNLPPATIGKTAGYTSVSASTFFTNNNSHFYSCWIQIESNIVVRVEIGSPSKESFDAAKNSLKTLKISKNEIVNIVKSSGH